MAFQRPLKGFLNTYKRPLKRPFEGLVKTFKWRFEGL
jgi:hypothetical protein